MDKQLGIRGLRERQYILDVPGHKRHALQRSIMKMPCVPLHEAIDAELRSDPVAARRALDDALASNALPPAFHTHPVVVGAGGRAWPVGIYMDGVKYSNTDSVWGLWAVSLLTERRHLLAVVRKRVTCQCGCRGWCSYYPLQLWLHWSVRAAAAGQFPEERPDGPWREGDDERRQQAGTPLCMPAAVLFLKGDWAEFCERLGYFTPSTARRPCLCCSARRDTMMDPTGVSLLSMPWPVNSDGDWERACRDCEKHVVVPDAGVHRRLLASLWYDKRPRGAHGRALRQDVPELGLQTGDRLEPTPACPDIGGGVDEAREFPLRLLFWRPASETMVRHRCPLLDPSLGLGATSCIALDTLHTLFLGPAHSYAKFGLWALLSSGAWGPARTQQELPLALLRCRAELHAFYAERHQEYPAEGLTRMSDLTVAMVGSRGQPKLKAKGAETWGLCVFIWASCGKHAHRLGRDGPAWRAAGDALLRLVDLMRNAGVTLPPEILQEMMDTYKRHVVLARRLSYNLIPKHHLMFHLLARAASQGNPRFYSTWLDESLNRDLKLVLRNVSQCAFERLALAKMMLKLSAPSAQKRRRGSEAVA